MHQPNNMNHTEEINGLLTQISYAIKQVKACQKEGLKTAERSYLLDISNLSLELSRLTAIKWSKAVNGETITKK